jgi:Flp pilus assembly protein TadG
VSRVAGQRTPTTAGDHRSRCRDQRGQAAVELALGIPVVMVVVLMVAQLLVVAHDHLHVEQAARTAVRAASVSADPAGSAERAASQHLGLRAHDVTTSVQTPLVSVTVTLTAVGRLPLVGMMVNSLEPSATAVMLLEPP